MCRVRLLTIQRTLFFQVNEDQSSRIDRDSLFAESFRISLLQAVLFARSLRDDHADKIDGECNDAFYWLSQSVQAN